MDKLRKHIKESFFNPILHFLPLLVFLIIDDFWGLNLAWKITFPFALILLMYVYFVFNRIFTWHLIFTLIFVVTTLLVSIEFLFPVRVIDHAIMYEIVLIAFFVSFIVFRQKIHRIVLKLMSNLIPMTNNFDELLKVIWALLLILIFDVTSFLIIQQLGQNVTAYHQMLQYLYVGVLLFFTIYEILRVKIIRTKLLKEEWWPIVNHQGKVVGSIHQNTSINDEKKYMHPVVRLIFVNKGMVCLVKNSTNGYESSNLWDSALSKHVKMNETVEQALEIGVEANYIVVDFKYMFLSNYNIETDKEIQYSFLFVSCLHTEFTPKNNLNLQIKWWTQHQIDENLNTGIFTENFKLEYELLKRSGLLENEKCECNCRLKEVIYNQSSAIKKII